MAKETRDRLVVGIDLGGTKILAGVVDAKGKIIGQAKRATKPEDGVEAVVERMAKTVREAVSNAELSSGDIAAVCSCAPADAATSSSAPHSPAHSVPPVRKVMAIA